MRADIQISEEYSKLFNAHKRGGEGMPRARCVRNCLYIPWESFYTFFLIKIENTQMLVLGIPWSCCQDNWRNHLIKELVFSGVPLLKALTKGPEQSAMH